MLKHELRKRLLPPVPIHELIALASVLVFFATAWPAGKATTVAEIALYQGPDRQEIPTEGAKKDGQIILQLEYDEWKGLNERLFIRKR